MSSNYNLIGIHVWPYTIGAGGVEEWGDLSTDGSAEFKVLADDSVKTRVNLSIEFSYYNRKTMETYKDSFIIPKGWEFDGASIPDIFWGVIGKPTSKKFLIPAAVHDWLYGIRFNRELSDEIFKALLIDRNVPEAKVALMWSAVRVFGHVYYASDTSDFYKTLREFL